VIVAIVPTLFNVTAWLVTDMCPPFPVDEAVVRSPLVTSGFPVMGSKKNVVTPLKIPEES
jgi:hypothetical protein